MEQPNRFWYLKNPYAWIVLVLGIVTAVIIQEFWVVLLGVIGFEFALLIDLTRGQSLGRSGRVRLARLEQEYRELKAEQARLIGAIDERDEKLAGRNRAEVLPQVSSGDQATLPVQNEESASAVDESVEDESNHLADGEDE